MSEMPGSNPEAATWSIVGAGNVGGALIDMVAKPEVAARHGLEPEPRFVMRKDGWHAGGPDGPLAQVEMTDVLFIATPSTPDHQPMLSLMRDRLHHGMTVVTAEKGVLAEHFEEMTALPEQVGYWATVGGGTKLVPKMLFDTRDPGNIKELHVASNATLTYTYSEVASGGNLDEVVDAAVKLGYAEPGATAAYDVIHGEAAGDVPRKTAIVLQSIFPEFVGIDLEKMDTELTEEQVMRSLSHADRYRYLVSVFPEGAEELAASRTEGRLGGFEFVHEGWLVVGGLQRVDRTNPLAYFKR